MSVNIGHNHPKVVKAIQEQAAKLIYTMPASATKERAIIGAKLAELCAEPCAEFDERVAAQSSAPGALRCS